MMVTRRDALGALICLCFVLVAASVIAVGNSPGDAQQGAPAGAGAATMTGKVLPGAATAGQAEGAALLDINSGDPVDVLNIGPDSVVALAPGDIKGLIAGPDGVSPHAGVRAVVLDASTGEEVMSAVTDSRGRYTLADVTEGRYILRVGEPGVGTVVVVARESEGKVVDFLIPETSFAPSPSGSEIPGDGLPLQGIPAVAEGGATVVAPLAFPAGGAEDDDGRKPRRTTRGHISPWVPGPPPWVPGPPPWHPGPPPRNAPSSSDGS